MATPDPALPKQNFVAGALFMISACFCFAVMMGLIRYLGLQEDGLHPFQIAFFRIFFGLLVMAPWLWRMGLSGLKTDKVGLYTLRACTGTLALLSWFWVIGKDHIPLADAVALNFTAPLFATMLAPLILGEIVRARRWTAVAVGFAGAMVIVRPGIAELTLDSGLVLFSALMIALSTMTIKILSRTENPTAIVAYMGIYLTPIALVPALFVWQWPTWEQLAILVALGAVATLAHTCFTRAVRAADATAVMPFDFSRLVFSAMIGIFVFGEVSDIWTWVGALIIAGAAVYIGHREARAGREKPASTAATVER
jgi:drug/metabolite transporter (DMT)-like permease